MYKYLIVGDMHLRGNNPRNRIDDYPTAAKEKLAEVFSLATKNNVEAIIQTGDVFDRPEVAIGVLLDYVKVLRESPVPIYTTIGNHDVYGFNTGSFSRSSLKLLEMLVPQLTVVTEESGFVDLSKGSDLIVLSATPYNRHMDVDGYGYTPCCPAPTATTVIHIAHGMLLDHKPPFDRYTLLNECKSAADVIISGHDHHGYGVYHRKDDKVFCNPGALLRISASVGEIERPVQVGLLTLDRFKSPEITLLPLMCAKPGEEVLDRSSIDEANQRQYAMEAFSTLIQTHTGGKVLMDVNQIIETIAAEEHFAPDVVAAALAVIDQQREAVGV